MYYKSQVQEEREKSKRKDNRRKKKKKEEIKGITTNIKKNTHATGLIGLAKSKAYLSKA